MPSVIACIPSRGLVHSRTAEAVYREMQDCGPVLYEHDKPIPDCFNSLVDRAMGVANVSTHFWIWLVEEDIVPSPRCLQRLIDENNPVVSAMYRLRGGTWSHRLDDRDELIFAGTGCLLVHARVFAALGTPRFRTDTSWSYDRQRGLHTPSLEERDYGGHDVDFFARLQKAGIRGKLAPVLCEHLYVAARGKEHSNDGCHTIKAF